MNLFAQQEAENLSRAMPLAARMRPRTLNEFAGQEHFLGEGKLLRRMLAADRINSVIFYGPPGTGKTSLAEVIAQQTKCQFSRLNAAASGVKELRVLLETARDNLASGGKKSILFIDELHRFNKAQQDVLLPDVEAGVISLIGATTANPFFSLVSPLVSRSQIFEFRSLHQNDIMKLMQSALKDQQRGLASYQTEVDEDALLFLAEICDGDGRRALSALEIAVLSVADSNNKRVDLEVAQESIQKKAIHYDATGDEHYDAASALIKSMRGSDPDATIYWLARMIEAGEDPRFLARRIVIAASEDVGNADPQALVIAQAAASATEFVGMPECRIILAQAAIYVATAPKSNASYKAIDAALADVREQRTIPVPVYLRDKHTPAAQNIEKGQGYKYAHNSEDGWVDQDYLGVERTFYEPVNRGYEAIIQQRLAELKQLKQTAKLPED